MINVQLEATDLAEAFKIHKRWGLAMWLLNGVAVIGPLGFGIWLLVWSRGTLLLPGIVLVVLAACLILFLLYAKLALIRQVARKRFQKQKELQRPYTLTWDDETFSRESSTGTTHMPWSDFIKWRESENLFLAYFTNGAFRLIPKRSFPDTQGIENFRNLLSKKIGPCA